MRSSRESAIARPSGSSIVPRFGLDTSCLIPLVAEWHQRHEQTTRDYRARLARGERPVIAGHALVECYSVLTRLPFPVRTDPETAEEILTRYFAGAEVAGVGPETCWLAMRTVAALNIGGGRVYDAVIVSAVAEAGARVFLTWNVRHYLAFAPQGLEIRQP